MNNGQSEACRLKEEYTFKDWIYWNLLIALPLGVALIGIGKQTVGGLIFYLILVMIGLGLILRYFCTHCPHYTRRQSSFSCLFFWKVPKIFPDRQGALDLKAKVLVALGVALIVAAPIFWLLETPSLLVIYLISLAVFVSTHLRNECSRCLFVECPMNRVPEALHAEARGMK